MTKKRIKTSNNFESQESISIFLNQASKYKPLSNEEEQKLATRCEQGDRTAMDKLVMHNILFMVTLATKYSTRKIHAEDLLQEAILGMYHGARKFKAGEGRFITYVVHWARAYIQRYVSARGSVVRFPDQARITAQFIHKAEARGGDRDTNTCDELRDRVPDSMDPPTDYRIEAAKKYMRPIASLNVPMGDSKNSSDMIEFVASEMPDPDGFIGPYSAMSALDIAFESLSDREIDIVIGRYMPADGYEETLTMLADRHGITRERARQIILEAFAKMRVKHNNLLADALGEEKYKRVIGG